MGTPNTTPVQLHGESLFIFVKKHRYVALPFCLPEHRGVEVAFHPSIEELALDDAFSNLAGVLQCPAKGCWEIGRTADDTRINFMRGYLAEARREHKDLIRRSPYFQVGVSGELLEMYDKLMETDPHGHKYPFDRYPRNPADR